MTTAIQIARLVAVMALVIAAAALATPKGRLPLALRGLMRTLRRDCGQPPPNAGECRAPVWKRTVAFLCVLLAAALALV